MILIALGANQSGPVGGPAAQLDGAIERLGALGLRVARHSRWWPFPSYPPGSGPDFKNGAARLETGLAPEDLLRLLRGIEQELGRERREPWGPRALDLDLLAYGDLVTPGFRAAAALGNRPPDGNAVSDRLILPHPRLHLRPFVLEPLREIAPDWLHPVFGLTPTEMLARLTPS